MLAVVNPAGRVVTSSSVLAGMAVAPSDIPRRVLRYGGDIGTGLQHLGPIIGPAAHKRLWPEILDWLASKIG
jgi:polyhydroxyalkanoate synthase subunit PhaC